ncbi:hypothetical protein F6Q07_21435 [Pectobacterium parmentieri]|uniref:HEAT repeat domain-containing protein n=1 Tax=Pectobacterium parmentieri TaxID=1905730 RepID=A0A0H3I966_PECPM|nr:hypothetical protein [Pectobacterium parmentieri]AFI90491.1 Hypothetical protein W5S_2403 [Pectobacterium parmentieri]AYH01631.1 hypothetical protein C5E26_12155 [Pectobacterium parmentieri]AYH05893.1 hypothetical protein C5E25_11310 [Pectobacterium parmentieri]AYH14714.1 hypothetical protein C5E23_11280 [Pectobacterium parmentieri]AYH23415.1 hypothetical protein C5E21_11285 [Pectobacterium parmentieri]
MNTEEALDFLSQNQPMPSDALLSKEKIDRYDEIRQYFINNPDVRAISLFLRSYGEGDGWGVYQLVEDFFYQCDPDDVKKEIKIILEDKNIPDSVRYWVTQVSAAFSDKMFRAGLDISLGSENPDIKEAAEIAISILGE